MADASGSASLPGTFLPAWLPAGPTCREPRIWPAGSALPKPRTREIWGFCAGLLGVCKELLVGSTPHPHQAGGEGGFPFVSPFGESFVGFVLIPQRQ